MSEAMEATPAAAEQQQQQQQHHSSAESVEQIPRAKAHAHVPGTEDDRVAEVSDAPSSDAHTTSDSATPLYAHPDANASTLSVSESEDSFVSAANGPIEVEAVADDPLANNPLAGIEDTPQSDPLGLAAASSSDHRLPTAATVTAEDDGAGTRPSTTRPHTVRWSLPEGQPQAAPELPRAMLRSVPDDDDADADASSVESAGGVFAFERPPTAPTGEGAGAAHLPATEGHHRLASSEHQPDVLPPPAAAIGVFDVDVGGYHSQEFFDVSRPPPFSGRDNLNNSTFAYVIRHHTQPPPPPQHGEPTTGHSASDFESDDVRPIGASDQSIMSTSEDDELTSDGGRPDTGRSYPLTVMTGDQTVPDGKTTWGDGVGGECKDASEEGGDYDWMEEDSPFAEVRASVSNIDDPEMPALTLRSWVFGMVLCLIVSGANTFFSFRNPTPTIPVLAVQIAAYPIGKFAAWALPIREYTLPRWLGSVKFSLNPCPFNVKEHTIIVMMASVAVVPAYGMSTIVASELWYGKNLGVGFSMLYILATQVTGMSLAGIARRFVVWPASMIWPGVLVLTTNLNTLHAEADMGGGGMSRLRFLLIVGSAAFLWYIVPGFLFTGLSYFSYATWIAPRNMVVNQLFGVNNGLGMGILTFDWAQIAWIGSPLTAPWWAQVNVAFGLFIFYWLLTPLLHYTNTWYTNFLPMSAISAADRYQNVYNVTRILTPEITLNTTAYAEYSPMYLTSTFLVTYMLAFALTTSLIVYTVLVHGTRIWRAIKSVQSEPDDIHMKLMREYSEVPDWWYLVVFGCCIVLGIVTIEVFSTGLPVWGYLVSIAMTLVYIIPSAIMYALANLEPAFNLIAELIPGYAFEGQPIAGMIFKTFAVQTLAESLIFVRDMKLGHYMKIPPRSMFFAQISACSIACFVQVGVKELIFRTIPDMCSTHQKYLLVCSTAKTMYTASITWGLIGPARLFDKGGIYRPQLWMLLVGALAPFPFWLYCRKYPKSIVRNVNVCLVFCVALFIPPATGINVASFLFVGFVFQFWVRRHAFAWWCKYNYVLSCALDVGTLLSVIFVFLVFKIPGASINWWGNTVYVKTLDWQGLAFEMAPATGFGPTTWKV